MPQTADFYMRYSDSTAHRAMQILADPHKPAREWAIEHGFAPNPDHEAHFTIGTLTATLGSLLDALGYPEQGPSVNQYSWLPDDDGQEEDDSHAASF